VTVLLNIQNLICWGNDQPERCRVVDRTSQSSSETEKSTMYYIELLRAIGFTLLLIWVVFISINGIIFFSLFGLFKKKIQREFGSLTATTQAYSDICLGTAEDYFEKIYLFRRVTPLFSWVMTTSYGLFYQILIAAILGALLKLSE